MYNLLTEPLIRVRMVREEATNSLSLADVLALMMRDGIAAFPAIRPHQRHAWHAFLAQLGAIALHRAGCAEPPEDTGRWRELLRVLTSEYPEDEPWQLVVEDASKPAFMQPPAPNGDLSTYRNRIEAADALDVLVTAKNFDLKRSIAAAAEADDWLFALIDLQTMEGYMGVGNYGIARMNGGYSARPFLGFAPADAGVGGHLRRDIRAMLALREQVINGPHGYRNKDGLALLWLLPWDGNQSLSIRSLDPYFIEICRRIRLGAESQRLYAMATGSKVARIAAKDLAGVTGDFWAPVNTKEQKAFSLTGAGFDTRILCRLLFDQDFHRPPALSLTDAERGADCDWLLVARGVSRSEGKTEGWHERIVPFRRRVVMAFARDAERMALGQLSALQLKEIEQIGRALRHSIAVIASGGDENGPSQDDYQHAVPFTARLQAEADAVFFEALQDRYEAGDDPDASAIERYAFVERLIGIAQKLLDQAAESVPCAAIRRPRARSRAHRAFWSALRSPKSVLREAPDVIDMMFPGEETNAAAEPATA